jgi:hypothetical protein
MPREGTCVRVPKGVGHSRNLGAKGRAEGREGGGGAGAVVWAVSQVTSPLRRSTTASAR